MNRVEVPADAIPFEDYIREVASAEINALENALASEREAHEAARIARQKLRASAEINAQENAPAIRHAANGGAYSALRCAIVRARQELRDKVCKPLRAGSAVAYGEPFGGFPIVEAIPAELWEHLEFAMGNVNPRPYCGLNDVWCGKMENSPGFHKVRIDKAELSREERCRIWLRTLVAAGNPKKTKYCRRKGVPDTAANSYWGEAQSTFSNTKSAFEAIWASGIPSF